MKLNEFLSKDNYKDYYLKEIEYISCLTDDDYINNKFDGTYFSENKHNYFNKNKDKIKIKLFKKEDINRLINLLDKYEHVSYAIQYYDLEGLNGIDKLKFNNDTVFESENDGYLWSQHDKNKINGILKKNVRFNLNRYLEDVDKGKLLYLIEINNNNSSSFILSHLDEDTIYREDFNVYLSNTQL